MLIMHLGFYSYEMIKHVFFNVCEGISLPLWPFFDRILNYSISCIVIFRQICRKTDITKITLLGSVSPSISKILIPPTLTHMFKIQVYISLSAFWSPIQHHVIKLVSNLWQVSSFLWVLRFSPPIKLTSTI
jgi:hypothetical protein